MKVWDKKRELKDRYDSTADFYDGRYRDIQEKKFRAVRKEFGDAEYVLEVGCGTGLFIGDISQFAEFYVGVDFSHEMLRKASSRAKDALLILADADNIPLKDSIFDAVISLTLLQNMPQPRITIEEMSRMTKEDGKIIITALEKKHSTDEIRDWLLSADIKPLKIGKLPDSEDILCVGRNEE